MTLGSVLLPTPDSPLRRIDARWKLAALILAMIAVIPLRELTTAGTAFGTVLVLAWLGRLPLRWYLMRLGVMVLLLSPFLLTLPLVVPGWGGVSLALVLAAKALSLMTLALVVMTSAPLQDTLKAAHALRVPGVLVQLFALTYRYLFLVAGELGRLRIALRARGYRNRPTRHCYRTIGHITGTLLVRSHERGERVSQAMRCRGFDGRYRSLTAFRTRVGDVLFFLVLTLSAAGLLFWDLGQRGLV
jgi:cobalt/nickel transport system permease protein